MQAVTPKWFLAAISIVAVPSAWDFGVNSAHLEPQTRSAFERYVHLSEREIAREQAPGGTFLFIDSLPQNDLAAALARLQRGEVVVERRVTTDDGKPIPVPGGMIHHWLGTVFVPGGTIAAALKILQDYDHHAQLYTPEVERSKLLERSGDSFKIYYRLRRKKVVTVVMDAYYDVHYGPVNDGRSTSRSFSTSIQEIEDPDTPSEKALPADDGNGLMWRLNTYWRYEERDGGLYIQCEAISLSRDIPSGLGWMIGPFVESIPRESLMFTLGRTREYLMASH
jgi:hypothetical protein